MDKLQEIIPNFFYDLISRIIPGSILLAFIISDQRFQPLLPNQFPEIILVISFLSCGYVFGFCVDSISAIIFFYLKPFFHNIYNRFSRNKIHDLDITKASWKIRDIGKEDVYMNLRKHRAEEALFRTLLLGWVLICFFDFYLAAYLSWMQKLFVFGSVLFAYLHRSISTYWLAQRALEIYGKEHNY